MERLMEILQQLDVHLSEMARTYHGWIYLIICGVTMLEAFPLLTPLLPSGAMLLLAGTLAATGELNLWWLLLAGSVGAIAGDTLNYFVGRGAVAIYLHRKGQNEQPHPRLEKVRAFYARYGVLMLLFGRFIPVVRTVAPLLAGSRAMTYRRFIVFSTIGCAMWAAGFLFLGCGFGHIPWARTYLPVGIMAVAVASLVIAVALKMRRPPAPPERDDRTSPSAQGVTINCDPRPEC
jgi:membrane-associated protein